MAPKKKTTAKKTSVKKGTAKAKRVQPVVKVTGEMKRMAGAAFAAFEQATVELEDSTFVDVKMRKLKNGQYQKTVKLDGGIVICKIQFKAPRERKPRKARKSS